MALWNNVFKVLKYSLQIRSHATNQEKIAVTLKNGLTVRQLAKQLNVKTTGIIKALQELGEKSHTPNTRMSLELAELVTMEMGHPIKETKTKDVTPIIRSKDALKPRPPIVTVMGHVDHGKTTLLDNLRSTSVASREAGGITQHIGAFSVPLVSGRTITFLDTPGHAAFSAMRSRGANVTDIVVLVIAADDGVMPQTVECIKMAQEEQVPIVVAINKCDKYSSNVSKVKQQLLQYSIQLEEFGGEVQAVEISALTGSGLDTLEEAIIVLAELNEVQADPMGPVEGVILEARNDKGLGTIATVLVLHGTLKNGCVLVAGEAWGKVRTMMDWNGQIMKQAPPSIPVLTAGWRELPIVGEKCLQVKGESQANEVIQYRTYLQRKYQILQERKRIQKQLDREEGIQVVPLVVKGDVSGSVEALVEVINSCQPKHLQLEVVQSGIGNITESEVELASSIRGVILAFNVTANKLTTKLAEQKEVDILSHNVIYKLLEKLKDWLKNQLPFVKEEEIIGEAVVLRVFKLRGTKAAAVGGCRVKKGQLVRDAVYQLWRNEELIHEGTLVGMKREKEDISMARKETECGLSFSKDPGWEEGDKIVCLRRKDVPQPLEWDIGF